MKKNLIIIGGLLMFLFTLACEKKYETEPEEQVLDRDVFDTTDRDAQLYRTYMRTTYSSIVDGFDRIGGDFLDAATDDAIPTRPGSALELYTNGQLTSANLPDDYWAESYLGIRRCNLMLQNADKIPMFTSTRNEFKGDARFIRAYMYFELLKRYGGVPIIGDTVFTLKDNMDIPRSTFEETVNYIVTQCNEALPFLNTNTTWGTAGFGRAPREAAWALKARVLLYAASPLFNGGGFETDPAKRRLTGYPTYDANRWNEVISAVDSLNAITPKYNTIATTGTFNTANYRNVFIVRYNPDIIFSRFRQDGTTLETANSPVGYRQQNARGRTSPTQNFVDAFPKSDGTPYTGGANNPSQYLNRDPRLYYNLFYNGLQWVGRPVETFEGGRDKPNIPGADQTRTGYYLQKFLGNFASLSANSAFSNTPHHFPIFRYAEICLNYAEALNEVGRTEEAVSQIIIIRRRAGITAGSNSRFGIPVGIGQNDMRLLIRNERRIELAFEEHRFWDIRRWKDEAALKATLTGVTITKNDANALVYTLKTVGTMKFTPKYYHMPIPFAELNRNSKLVQNEGW